MDRCWPLQMQPTAKAVLIALADEADEQGVCVPTLSVLRMKTCFERTAVIDAVRWLEGRGAILGERSEGKPTRFTVQPQAFVEEDEFAPTSTPPVPVTSPPDVPVKKRRSPPGVTIDATSEGFQRFWRAYPNTSRKISLANSWRLWQQKGCEAMADHIERHVLAMKESRKWKEGYEPATTTYLNQSRWNDPIPQAGLRNEARSYFEETLRGAGGSQATGHDADALRRGVPPEVARLLPQRNG